MSDEEFRAMIGSNLSCRVADATDCSRKIEEFLSRCFYQAGQYDALEDYAALDRRMTAVEERFKRGDRVFYLSIPPNIFTTVAASASTAASSKCALKGLVGAGFVRYFFWQICIYIYIYIDR